MAKTAKDQLTEKQELFCLEYCKDFNATRSYKDAGYSAKTDNIAGVEGNKLLKNPKIARKINELQTERAKNIKIDAGWVLQKFIHIADKCSQSIDVVDREGNPTGRTKMIDAAGANRATELIAKHLGMFVERIEQHGEIEYKVVPNSLLAPKDD